MYELLTIRLSNIKGITKPEKMQFASLQNESSGPNPSPAASPVGTTRKDHSPVLLKNKVAIRPISMISSMR